MALLKSQPCVRLVLIAAFLCLTIVLPTNAQDDGSTQKADQKKPVAKKPVVKQEARTPTSTPATRAAGSAQLRRLEALKRLAQDARTSDSKAGAKPEATKPAIDPKRIAGPDAGKQPTSKPAVKFVEPGERKKRDADEVKRRMDAAAKAAGERRTKGAVNPSEANITKDRSGQDRESRRAELRRKAAEARKQNELRRLEREKQTEKEEGAPDDMLTDRKPTPWKSEQRPVVKKPAPPADGRTEWFNFDGMPWEDVILHFAKRLGKPLMDIDEIDIGGHLTYINSRKFTKQEAIDELNLLLHRKGWRFIDTEFHIFAVPLNEMSEYVDIERTYKTRAEFEKENLRDMEYAAVYMKIEDRQAQDVVETFGDAIPDYGRMSVVGKSNKIKILALAKDLRKLFSLYDMIDLEIDDGRQIKIFTIKTNVRDIERMLRDIEGVGLRTTVRRTSTRNRTSTPSAAADMSSVRMTADERTNTLVVKGTQSQIERIGKFIKEIDQLPELGKFYTEVIEIKHAKAVEVANAMTQIFQQEQGRTPSWQRLQQVRRTSRSSRNTRAPTRSSSSSAQATPADLMGESAFERAKKTILVSPYERTNSIIVYANLEGHERVTEMLEDLDTQLPSNFRTFKLEHARAEQIFNTVNKLVQGLRSGSSTSSSRTFRITSRAATVTPDPVQNALHVLAEPSEMEKIEEIIKQLDVAVSDENRHVVELINMTPSRMAQIIQPILAGGGSAGRPGFNVRRSGRSSTVRVAATSQIIPIDEANLLVVICDEKTWARVDKLIKAADENALTATPEIRHYEVLKANPNVLVNSLNTFYRNYQHPTLGRSSVVFTVSGKKITAQGVKPALDEIASLIETMDQEDAQRLEILELIHADATQVAQQMQPLFAGGRGGIRGRASGTGGVSIQADAVTNSLIVQADSATLEKIKGFALRMDEKVGAQKPEQKFYTLKHARPREVSQAISTLFAGSSVGRGRFGRTPTGAQVKTVVSGQQIIVEAPAEKHLEISELIAQLDDPSGLEIVITTVKMPGTEVNTIASKLTAAFREKVRKQGIVARFDADPASETILVTCSKVIEDEAKRLLKEYEEHFQGTVNEIEFRKLEHSTATDAVRWLRDQLIAATREQLGRNAAARVQVTADARTNRIIINAPSVAVKLGMNLLEQYDVPAEQAPVHPVEVRRYKLAGLEVDRLSRTLTTAYRNYPQRPDKLRIVFTSDSLTESLVVSAPTDEFERIEKLVKDFETDTLDLRQTQKFIKIVEADASYVADQVRNSLIAQISRQRGPNVARRVSIQVDTRLNRLNVDAPQFAMTLAEALIKELDQVSDTGRLKTIPLEHVEANNVHQIIRTIFSDKIRNRTLTVSVESVTNSLIVGASQKDFEEIQSWATELDEKSSLKGRQQKIIDLTTANPHEVRNILTETFVQRRTSPAKRVAITVIAGRSLVISAPPDAMEDIEAMIEKLDAVHTNMMRVETFRVPGLGSQLTSLARQIQSAVNGQLQRTEKGISVTPLTAADTLIVTATEKQFPQVEAAIKKFENLFQPHKIETIELVSADANAVYTALNRVLSPRIRAGKMTLGVESMTNSLIVSAAEEDLAEIREWAAKFDLAAERAATKPKVFELKNADTREVLNVLNATFVQRGSRARSGGRQISFSVMGGSNIVVHAPADKMNDIETLIAQLDEIGIRQEGSLRALRLVSVEANQVASTLKPIYDAINRDRRNDQSFIPISITAETMTNSLLVIANDKYFEQIETEVARIELAMSEIDVTPVRITVKHLDPNDVRRMINDVYPPNRRSRSSTQNVTVSIAGSDVILKGPPKKVAEIKELIAGVDVEGDQLEIKTYTLKVLDAQQTAMGVQLALRTLMGRPRPGQMQPGAFAEPSTNTLIVLVDKQHALWVDMLIAKLEMYERPISTPRTYELQHVRAEIIAEGVDAMLKAKVLEREGQRKQQTVYTAVHTAPGSNRLIVFAPDEYHKLATEMIRMLDEEVDSGEIVHIIQLDNADAVNLAQSINQTLSSGGGQSFGGRRSRFNMMAGGSSDRQVTVTPDADSNSLIVSGLPKDVAYVEELIKELELKSTNIAELQIFGLQYSSAFDVADTLSALFPRGRDATDTVTVTPDPYYNKVIVTANKRKMRIVEGYLAQLDKSPYDEQGNFVGMGGKKLFFVDVYRGDAFDIAMDVADLYPPEGGPEIDADWFGEYIKVLCRESEFPRIEELIRDFDARARVAHKVEFRPIKGDVDRILSYLQQRDPDLILKMPEGGKPKRTTIVETLWDDDEEPPFKAELERKRNKVRNVKEGIDPIYIDMAFATAWFAGTLAWDDVQESNEPQDAETPQVVPSESTKQDTPAKKDKPVLRREAATVQVTPDGRLIISGSERAVDDVSEILDLMEDELNFGEVIRIFKFRYGDVTSASQILNQMFNERVVITQQRGQQPQQGQRGRGQQGQQGQQEGKSAQQGGQAALLQQLMGARQQGGGSSRRGGQRVRIATDPGHNYLIVKCDESDLPEIRQLLRELDIPPGQVDINVIQLKTLDATATALNIKEVLGIGGTARGRTQRTAQARGGNQQQQLMQVLQQQLITLQSGAGGAAKIESVEIVPNVVTNSLMVSAPPDVMEIIVGVIADLEELEAGDNIVIRYYDMQKARVDDVLPLLQEIFAAATGGGGRRGGQGSGSRTAGSRASLGPVTISGDPRTNTLIYTAMAKDVERVELQISKLDIDGTLAEAEMYVCQYGDATAIAAMVEGIYGSGGGRQGGRPGGPGATRSTSDVRIVSDATTNAIIVWGPPDKRDLIFTKIVELDDLRNIQTRDIPVVHADPEDLADTLNQMFGGQGVPAAATGSGRRGTGRQRGGQTLVGGRVVIIGNKSAKKILVRAPDHVYRQVIELVQVLDQPDQQLQIRRFQLEFADAGFVVDQVRQAMQEYMIMAGRSDPNFKLDAFTAIPDARTNSVMVVGSEKTFLFIQSLLAAVDIETPDIYRKQFKVFVLQRADAATVAAAINSMTVGGASAGAGRSSGRRGGRGGMPSGGAAAGGGELHVVATAEPGTNSVMVFGLIEDIARVETSIIDEFERISELGAPYFRKLEFAKADTVAQTLTQFFQSRQGSGRSGGMRITDQVAFSADPDSNTLIILASGTNREFVQNYIDQVDTEEGGRSIDVIQLQFASASGAAQVIAETFEPTTGGGGRGRGGRAASDSVTVSPDIPSNTVIVSANPTNMKKIHELLDTLERTIAIQFEPVTIEVHNAPPSQIVSFIQQFLGDSGGDGQGGGRRGQTGGARRGPNIVPNDNAMTLIVSGSVAEVERIRVLAAKFDDPQIVSSQIKVIPIPRGQDAFTLAATVEQLVNNSEAELAARTGRLAKQIVVGADGYSNAIILGGDATLFGMAVTIIDQLGLVRTENIVTRVINLKNLSADDLKSMIDDLQNRRASSSRGTIRRTGGTTGTFNRGTGGTNRRRTTPTGGGTRRRGRGMLWQPDRLQLDPNMLHQPASYGSPIVTETILTPSVLSAIVTGLLRNDGASDQDATVVAGSSKKAASEFAVVDLIDDLSLRFKRSLGLDRARDWWKKTAEREVERLRHKRQMTAALLAEVEKPAVVGAAKIESGAIENEFPEMAEALRAADDRELRLELPADAVAPEIAAATPVAEPAQEAERAAVRQPVSQDQPKEQPQGTLDERLLQGVSGELKGEVTATVIDGGTIFITGDEDDIRFIEMLAAAMELSAPKPEIAVFTLKTANAAALAPALEQTIQGIMDVRSTTQRPADRFTIIPDPKSNSLIVSASQNNMLLIEDLIAKLDIDATGDFQFKNVLMKNARAVEAAVQITPIIDQLSTVRGLPAEAQPKIQAIDRSNSIMIMGTPPAIEEIERLIEAYDVEITAEDSIANAFSTAEMIWIPIKNGDAEDIATALSDMIKEQQDAAVAADPTRPGLPVIRKIRMSTLSGEVLPELDLEKPIRILADKGTNSLIVFSTRKNIESLTAMVSLFDTLPTGVEIEVKSFALKNAESETVAEKLQEIFDDGKKALMRPSASGATFPDGVMPPVPPSIAAKGLPYEVHVTHDGRSNTVFVIGHKDAVLLAAGLITEMDKPNANLGMRYEVIEVEHQASQLAEKLTDLLDKRQAVLGTSVKNPQRDNALITPDDRANLLIVMAPNDVFEMVIDLIERIDGAPNNRIVATDFRALDFADANKLAVILQELFDAKKEAEGAVTPDVKDELHIIADPRSNSLMLTGTLDYMDEVKDLIDKLDRKFDPTVEFKIRPVRLTSAANLANTLQNMVDRQQENQETARFGTTPIYISSDPFTNNLIVGASKEDMDMLDRWIEVLDKPYEFGRVTRIFPLTSRLSAEETAGKLEPAFSQISGGGQGGQSSDVTITFDAGTNAIFAIGPPAILDDIEHIIDSMENVDIRAIAKTRKFDLKEADAETVAELLQGILEGRSGTLGQTGAAAARADAVREVMLLYERLNPDTGVTTIERLMRADVTVLADTRTDSIWITAPVESMPMMESLVAAVDVPPKAAKIRIFPLRNADAEQMVETLQDLFPDSNAQTGGARTTGENQTQLSVEGLGGGGRQEVTFTTDMRTNSVIAAGTKGALDIVSEFILELDTRPIRGRTTRVYTPRNNPSESIAASLNEFSDAQLARLDQLEDISDMLRMEYEITAISNEDSNTLLLSYDPRRESEVLDIIHDLDQPPPQVMIEVLIVEVTLDNSLELGVEFAFQDLQFAKAGPSDTTTFDFVGGTDLGAAGAGLGGFTFTITGADFNFLLRALQSTGSLNVLSRPMIMAMDNQEAVFEVVNDVPYVTSTAVTTGGVSQTQIARSDVGIKLTVTPQINPDGFVRMQIVQEVSDFGGGTIEVGAGVTAPIFFRRTADTTVTVMDNETVVLGGMIQSRTQSIEQKIPILGDLPLLGWLFRHTVETTTKSELLIILTPRVVRTVEDFQEVSIAARDSSGIISEDVLTSPLMNGLRLKPEDLFDHRQEDFLAPFDKQNGQRKTDQPVTDDYGPLRPARLNGKGKNDAQQAKADKVDPNSYDLPIVRRGPRG